MVSSIACNFQAKKDVKLTQIYYSRLVDFPLISFNCTKSHQDFSKKGLLSFGGQLILMSILDTFDIRDIFWQ